MSEASEFLSTFEAWDDVKRHCHARVRHEHFVAVGFIIVHALPVRCGARQGQEARVFHDHGPARRRARLGPRWREAPGREYSCSFTI